MKKIDESYFITFKSLYNDNLVTLTYVEKYTLSPSPCIVCNQFTTNFFYNGGMYHLFPETLTIKKSKICLDCFLNIANNLDEFLFKSRIGLL